MGRTRSIRRNLARVPRTRPSCRKPRAARRAALALLWLCGSAAAETGLDASVDAAYDSNVTRAQRRQDIRSDEYASAHAGAWWRGAVGERGTVKAGAGVRAAQYVRFPRLSFVALDASGGYRHKLGVGLTAPWVAADAALSHENYREDARDSDRVELRVSAGRRWSEMVDASAGYAFDRRYARHDDPVLPGISGAVWDIKGNSGFVRIGYAPDEQWQLDLGYALRRGDVVATTHRNRAIFLASSAIAVSDAFGPGFYDYRLRGTTQTATAALSYALGALSSLNVGYAFAFTRAAQGLEYRSHLVNAAWVYRY